MHPGPTIIGRLRIRGLQRDVPAMRLAIADRLVNMKIAPDHLPPPAIYLVRKLCDLHSRRLSSKVLNATPDRIWEKELKVQLEELYQRATRPNNGVLNGNDAFDAVLFSDEAELLACLLLDMAKGQAHLHWWWRFLLEGCQPVVGISGKMRLLLENRPRYIPSALTFLANWHAVDSVVPMLGHEDAIVILSAMLNTFDLGPFADSFCSESGGFELMDDFSKERSAAMIVGTGASSPLSALQTHRGKASKMQTLSKSAAKHDLKPPWRRWLGQHVVPADLSSAQNALVALALVLHSQPQVVHRTAFQRDVQHWWQAALSADREMIRPIVPSLIAPPPEPNQWEPSNSDVKLNHGKASDAQSGRHPKHLKDQKIRVPKQYKLVAVLDPDRDRGAKDPVVQPAKLIGRVANTKALENRSSDPADFKKDTPFDSDELISKAQWPLCGLPTQLGGIWYLINLMDNLDLPNCFEPHWKLASGLSRWALLEGLARGLLNDYLAYYSKDPIWKLLADLDGRKAHSPLGAGIVDDGFYQLPQEWLHIPDLKHSKCLWGAFRNRLRIWLEAGFLLVEMPHRQPINGDAVRETLSKYFSCGFSGKLIRKPYGKAPLACLKRLTTQGISMSLARRLSFILPVLRKILSKLLELPSATGRSLAVNLFNCPGQLHVTATHIDFVTDINNSSIHIRKAGLDRNPGWLPQWGRVVKFHFQ